MAKNYEMDMCNGPLLKKILMFSMPLMASSILQLLFNAADMIVAGRFAGSNALGAVGATSSLINLLVNVFLGLSVGANVAIANFYGAGKPKEVSDTVHTTVALALICGVILIFIGQFASGPILRLMGTPEEILPHSVEYMRIYFAGMPMMLLYNFGAAILRAVGDTKRPLQYLTFAGIINVGLNLIFVIRLDMGVRGVALATIISQTVSALWVLKALATSEGVIKFEWKKLKIHADKVVRIAKVGLPAGLQGAVFAISNVLIQSSVNSFGAVAVAGNTAAMNLEGFVYMAMNTFHQTAISFAGQNTGARKYDRVRTILLECLACATVTGLVLGVGSLIFSRPLLGLYTKEASVIAYGHRRLQVIMTSYFLCGIMDATVGVLRGMGYSIVPMIISLLGACAFRIVWIFTVFVMFRSLECLYISYPISWLLTFAVQLGYYIFVSGKIKKT